MMTMLNALEKDTRKIIMIIIIIDKLKKLFYTNTNTNLHKWIEMNEIKYLKIW